ncbi:MAG: class I SAM-dependent methyltransferase [Chloroflexota bacterium]
MIDHFGLIAPIYDKAIPFSRLQKMIELLDLPVDGILLDAGGGTGRVTIGLKPYLQNIFVTDLSEKMLAQSIQKGLPALKAILEHLPYAIDTFDRVIMVDALHHVYDQSETIQELLRVLKPGGILLIEEPDLMTWQVKILAIVEKLLLMRSHFLSPEEICRIIPAGYSVDLKREGYNSWIIVKKMI